MKKVKCFVVMLLIASVMTGCVTQPLQAPCDPHAVLCGSKHRINQ